MHYKNNKSDNSASACQDALAVQGTWCLHSKGAVPGRGLNNNIIFRGNSNYQQLTSNLKKIILCGNLRVICGNLRSDVF